MTGIWGDGATTMVRSESSRRGIPHDIPISLINTLAKERRGGRGGGGIAMLVRLVGRDQRPWNKGLLIGQKKPLEPKHVWSIRVRLEISRSWRDLVIFNLD